MVNENLERTIIRLVAADRTDIPISSMSGKLKRRKPKIAQEIREIMGDTNSYEGERVFARIESGNKEKARVMKDAVEEFCKKYQREGEVLKGMIAEKRIERETHLYCGMNPTKLVTRDDYLSVMQDLGYSPSIAEPMYEAIIAASRNISKKRSGDRAILLGKSDSSEDSDNSDEE